MKDFVINFVGLNEGKHDFQFEITDKFFESIDYSEIRKGAVLVDLLLEKKPGMMLLNFKLKGAVEVTCDRCADEFSYPIDQEEKLIVKVGGKADDSGSSAEEVIFLTSQEHQLDLTHFLYESVKLAIPLKIVHPDDASGKSTCNPEVLKKLEDLSGGNNNDIDPRWDKLKSFSN
ncbi:MAG: YceD family protein [Flavobacteriales bacterium]